MLPSSLLFISTIILGSIIALSSNNWLYLWIGLELNLLSFIPLIINQKLFQETQAAVKYFIIQAIGSGVLLTAGTISNNFIIQSKFFKIIQLIFLVRIIIKLGIAPLHQWLPHVISALSWEKCIILATWQKLAPLSLLLFILPKEINIIGFISIIISALIGGLGGINQSQIRPLLAYSSIGHMAWIMALIIINTNIILIYFIVYVTINLRLIARLKYNILFQTQSHRKFNNIITHNILATIIIIIRLGGLPPLLGFIPKWLTISTLIYNKISTLLIPLISGTIINLFFYLNIIFNIILSSTNPTPLLKINKINIFYIIIATIRSIIFILWPCSWLQH